MPRTARACIGGICYHVLNRGNARQDVFHEDDDPADAHEPRQKSRMSPFPKHNEKALETLLTYYVTNTVNLETLMFRAYNMKLKEPPFLQTHQLEVPEPPQNPFAPDMKTIHRIRGW